LTLLIIDVSLTVLPWPLPQSRLDKGKKGEKVDKSLLIEEMIVEWLKKNKF